MVSLLLASVASENRNIYPTKQTINMQIEQLILILEDHGVKYTKVSDTCVLAHDVIRTKDGTWPDETINIVGSIGERRALVTTIDNQTLSLRQWLGY